MINPDIFRFLEVWDAKWSVLPADADVRGPTHPVRGDRPRDAAADAGGVETDEEHWIDSRWRPGAGAAVPPWRGRCAAGADLHARRWLDAGQPGNPLGHHRPPRRRCRTDGDLGRLRAGPGTSAFRRPSCNAATVLRWAGSKAADLGIDPARIAIGGDSAGANLAAAVALSARDRGLPLKAQLLIYPACDFDRTPAVLPRERRGSAAEGRRHGAHQCALLRRRGAVRKTIPVLAPLVASTHAGLPPAFIAVAQYDPLRDSGRRLCRRAVGGRGGRHPRPGRGDDPRLPAVDGILRRRRGPAWPDDRLAGRDAWPGAAAVRRCIIRRGTEVAAGGRGPGQAGPAPPPSPAGGGDQYPDPGARYPSAALRSRAASRSTNTKWRLRSA